MNSVSPLTYVCSVGPRGWAFNLDHELDILPYHQKINIIKGSSKVQAQNMVRKFIIEHECWEDHLPQQCRYLGTLHEGFQGTTNLANESLFLFSLQSCDGWKSVSIVRRCRGFAWRGHALEKTEPMYLLELVVSCELRSNIHSLQDQ